MGKPARVTWRSWLRWRSKRFYKAAQNLWYVVRAIFPVAVITFAVIWLLRSSSALAATWHAFDAVTQLTVVAVLFAWLIYRLSQASERDGVIHGLRKELDLHRNWTEREYPRGTEGKDWDSPWYSVYQLSSVAIDNAIGRGPGLFLSRGLVELIVGYRQSVNNLNQLIATSTAFQVELAAHFTDFLVERIRGQTKLIHWEGIGDRNHRAAHYQFRQTCLELYAETHTPFSFIVWFLTGIRIYVAECWFWNQVWRVFRLPETPA